MMRKARIYILAFLCLFFSISYASDKFIDDYVIRIENKEGGQIAVSRDVGKKWIPQGKVLSPVTSVNTKGYTASQWISTGEVAAAAVNAIHIKTASPKTIFSILPFEFQKQQKRYRSYFNSRTSLYTDIESNHSIFGGSFSPTVGSRVLVNSMTMKPGYNPAIGDVFSIFVSRPLDYPEALIFENRVGGRVRLLYKDGREETVASVRRRVIGVGRFSGSRFLNAGRIRANHPGVIDISTSVSGKVGGFQIIPSTHSESPEMKSSQTASQWMIVGPLSLSSRSLEGVAPLFNSYLRPNYSEEDIFDPEWKKKFLGRFLVDVKINGHWRPMPIFAMNPLADLPPEANTFLRDVEEIRILFPR